MNGYKIPNDEWAELMESGLLLENGDVLTDGKLLKVARECKRLFEAKDYKGFVNLLENDGLSEEDSHLLSHTVLMCYTHEDQGDDLTPRQLKELKSIIEQMKEADLNG